jgi:hypothetical protein
VLSISTPNFFITPSNSSLLSFNFFNNDSSFELLEDNYENLKNIKLIYYLSHVGISFSNLIPSKPVAYTSILDSFRPDFDENNWNLNNEYSLKNSNYNSTLLNNNALLTNSMKLRKTAKDSIVAYNAIQKVYKSRFDDNRTNLNFSNFTNSYIKQSYITEPKIPYENMLGKNFESFFNVDFYNHLYHNNNSEFLSILNSNNMVFIDIPFLLSMKSDAARYL